VAGRTVGDVLGQPESWPSTTAIWQGMPNLRVAVITSVLAVGDELIISTTGGSTGPTVSKFAIGDAATLAALDRVLRPGLRVHDAVALEI
jgi:hypothetical protein